MPERILILGAGFGGLELATTLSEELADRVEVTLIDKNDSFVFGYAKLDVLFGRASAESVKLPYSEVAKPGVKLLRETVTAIDPQARRVTTNAGTHEADILVIALGADYDFDATPGLADGDNEFYSVPGAERMAKILPEFGGGRVIVGVCGAPFKCPPAPSECALLMHDLLTEKGVRESSEIILTMPLPSPVPPSPQASEALLEAFGERGIEFIGDKRIVRLDTERKVVVYQDGDELPYDLFMGVPKHRAPDVVIESGMTEEGYIPVDSATLTTKYENVFAVGDVATVGVPKAGVFAEGAARIVAREIIARLAGGEQPEPYDGKGACYVEFGGGRVGRVDVDFLSGPKPTGSLQMPSVELVADKKNFGATRAARWFGR